MNEKFDVQDRNILAALQQDCSVPLDALSDAVSLSRNACWRRIKRMEETGLIRARVALLDPVKAGVPLMVMIAVRTRHHDADWSARFLRALKAFPEITAAWRTSGDTDYVLQARVADVAAYDTLYQRLITKIDLEDVSASFVMEELKATTELPL